MSKLPSLSTIASCVSYPLLKYNRVYVAKTDAEIDAIRKLVYDVYVRERKYNVPGLDHATERVSSDEDTAPHTKFLYMKDKEGVVAVCRMRIWSWEDVPESVAKDLSLDLMGDLKGIRIAELSRFAIAKRARGKKLVYATLMLNVYESGITTYNTDLQFVYCAPGLVKHYTRFGLRPYGGRLVEVDFCSMIPLVCVVSDKEHMIKVRSPGEPAVRWHFRKNGRKAMDVSSIQHLLTAEDVPVELDVNRLTAMLHQMQARHECRFLQNLSPEDVRILLANSFALKIPARHKVLNQGTHETELYLILEGRVEIVSQQHRYAEVGPGNVIGEVAFLTDSQQRTATAHAMDDCNIIVIKKSAIEKLNKSNPEAGSILLFNLARIVADRLITTSQRYNNESSSAELLPQAASGSN